MRKIQKAIFLLIIIPVSTSALTQTRANNSIDEQYNIENVFGVVKATNGGLISGFYYRHSRKRSEKSLANIGVEMANIKHPREAKETTFTGNTFIFGKSNYLLAIRPTYGREKRFYSKRPPNKVQGSQES